MLLHIMLHIKFRRSRIVCLIRKQMKIKTICRHEIVYKNGKSPLAIRFTHQRTHKTVSLGISVEPHYWDKDAEMITANCPERVILQSKIDSTLAIYRKKIQRLEALDMEIDFTNLFDLTAKCTPQLVDSYLERQIAAMKQAGRINTAIKYTATRTSLVKFHPAKLQFEDITPTCWSISKHSCVERETNPIQLPRNSAY